MQFLDRVKTLQLVINTKLATIEKQESNEDEKVAQE